MENEFWCPKTLIDTWHRFIARGIPNDGTLAHRYPFIRNIGYSLQYLEFLQHQISSERLHSTISTHIQKSFVVTGMSIIEAIIWYVLKKNQMQKTQDWEVINEQKGGTFVIGDEKYRIKNIVEVKLSESRDVEANLMWMIRKVERRSLIGLDIQVYKDLNFLRNLRNKVHIHAVQHDTDTDWNAFSEKEMKLMKKALYGVLNSEIFHPETEQIDRLDFLRVEEETEDLVDEIHF